MQDMDGKLSVGVSDPTQLGRSVEIILETEATKLLSADQEIKVSSFKPVRLSVNLDKSDGKTFRVEFQK